MHDTDGRQWRKPGRNRIDNALREDIGLAIDAIVDGRKDPAVGGRVLDGLGRLSVFDVPMVGRALREGFQEAMRHRPTPQATLWQRLKLGSEPSMRPQMLGASGALAWIQLFHTDGRQREKALNAIHTPPPSGFWLAVLILRGADWAGEVRDAARRCIDRVIPQTDADTFVDGLMFYLDQGARQRFGFGSTLENELFTRGTIHAALLTRLLISTDGATNRLFRPIVAAWDVLDGHLLQLAGVARHPAIRARALRTLIEGGAEHSAGYTDVWVDKSMNKGRQYRRFDKRPVAHAIPMAELIALGAGDPAISVRKIAADGLIMHRATLEDAGAVLSAFDGEKAGAVLDRLDFVKRQLGEAT